MPGVWDEFTASELSTVLAQSRWDADHMLGLAHDLEVKLPGTKAAFLDGIVNAEKAESIARATAVLNPEEARAAEALVLGRAGRLTPAGLRSAIARAVIEVAPEKARKRRKKAERDARVERWAEVSGNGGLAGRELPPAAVIAADQKITSWARQLKQAGLAGSMDELRARAYIDLLLGTDSRLRQEGPGQAGSGADRTASPGGTPPGTGALPAGFGGRVNLTVTLDPIPVSDCDHRYEAKGHDPGVKLRHLSQIRHATCTGPGCRRPSTQADFEHNIPYEAGGRSCLCNGGPKCRYDHRLKQHPRWKVEQLPGGTFRWTTPSGRQCTTEATRYPI